MSSADGVMMATTAIADGCNWHAFINFGLFVSFGSKVPHFVARINANDRPVVWQGGRFEPIREAAQGWAPALMSTARIAECGRCSASGEHHLDDDGDDAT